MSGWNGHPTLGTPAKPNVTYTNSRINHLKITQPYSFGIRYVLSFYGEMMRKFKMFMVASHCEHLARRVMSLRAKTSISEFLRGNPQNKRQIKFYGLPRKANALLAMTRKYTFVILAFALFLTPNLAFAEQSGWFVGMQAGVGKGEIETELDGTGQRYTNVQNNRSEFSNIKKQARTDTSKSWGVAGNVRVVEEIPWDPTDGGVSWDPNAISTSQKNNIVNYIPGQKLWLDEW